MNYIQKEKLQGYALISPLLIILLGLIAYPFIYAIYLSFTQKMIGKPINFVGLKNYIKLLSSPVFYQALKVSIIYTIFAVVGKLILGTVMAELLNKSLVGQGFLRGIMLLPWIVPTFISAYTWQWLFSDFGGLLNFLVDHLIWWKHVHIQWLSNPDMALFSVIMVNIWRGFPFIGISLLAGMQGIPNALYESAQVDGANYAQKFIHITTPSLKTVYTVTTLLTLIWTLNDFELVYILTKGGPINSTKLFSILSYEYAFGSNDLGLGTTVSMIIAPLVFVLMMLGIKHMYKEDA